MKIRNQKKLIEEGDWKFLIVLDACRYDYFEKLYRDYLGGDLSKVRSSGSSTNDWRKNTFNRYYEDVIYISANPKINSKTKVQGFNARNYFFKVIDVWDKGWNSNWELFTQKK